MSPCGILEIYYSYKEAVKGYSSKFVECETVQSRTNFDTFYEISIGLRVLNVYVKTMNYLCCFSVFVTVFCSSWIRFSVCSVQLFECVFCSEDCSYPIHRTGLSFPSCRLTLFAINVIEFLIFKYLWQKLQLATLRVKFIRQSSPCTRKMFHKGDTTISMSKLGQSMHSM